MSNSQTATVRSLSERVTKGTTPTTLGRAYTSHGVRFLKVETFADDGTYIPGREAFIDNATNQLLKRSQLGEGDILFSIAGALGRSTIVEREWLPANTNQAFAIIKPRRRGKLSIDPRYLLWALRSPEIAHRIAEINVQAAQANLSLEQVREFEIPVVSLIEQRRIVAALDDISRLIRSLERGIAKKRAIKQGMMQELLTGHTRLPGYDRSWTSLQVAKFSHLKARIGWQGLTTGEYRLSGDYRLVGGTDFKDGRIDWATTSFVDKWRYDQDPNIQLRVGDVLLTKDGTIGKVAFVDHLPGPTTLNSGVFVLRPKSSAYDSGFLYWLLRSRAFEDFVAGLSAGSTINHLYQRDLVTLELEAPIGVDEQRAIAGVLFDVDREILGLQERLRATRSLKLGMMQELLTGRTRLVPTEASV